MRIEKERIEAVKRGVDLVALVQSKGIELKKNGKGWFGLCPFHEDKNPSLSVTPDKNLWRCFGCGAAGDAIRFVELFDKIPFPEAVDQLSVGSNPLPVRKATSTSTDKEPKALSVKEKKASGPGGLLLPAHPGRR